MTRKLVSSTLALIGLLMCLGAFGHSFIGRRALDIGLARAALDTHTEKLIYLVWYFTGGCMLVFGLMVIAGAWRAWRGEKRGLSAAGLIGVFYLLTGLLSLAYMREAFWSVFVLLGALALILSLTLSATSRAGQPS
ncbi:MAG: hypothetical protein WBW93_03255 [Steroidobacteraceae bacterium]